jgi:hypothetical protein
VTYMFVSAMMYLLIYFYCGLPLPAVNSDVLQLDQLLDGKLCYRGRLFAPLFAVRLSMFRSYSESDVVFDHLLIDYGQILPRALLRCHGQAIQNLMGLGHSEPYNLIGDLFDQDLELKLYNEENHGNLYDHVHECRLFLAYLFGDLDLANCMAQKLPSTFTFGSRGPG